jgi:hypothetical protein
MNCEAWREASASIDPWYLPLFFGFVVVGLVLCFARLLAAGPYRKYLEKEHMTDVQHRQLNQHLRDTGRGWIVAGWQLLLPLLPFVFVWPLVSPTFCEQKNMRCERSLMSTRQFIGPPCAGSVPDPSKRAQMAL